MTLALPHQRRTMERMAREAGIDAMPTKAVPGDERLAATGAVTPSGIPVPEDQVRRVLEGHKRGGGRPSRWSPWRWPPRPARRVAATARSVTTAPAARAVSAAATRAPPAAERSAP